MTSRVIVVAVAVSCGTAACGSPDGPPIAMVCDAARPSKGVLRTQCGATLDFTPVNAYEGEIVAVHDREDAVVLVNGNCTGSLIAAGAGPIILTAGHCVGLGDQSLLAFNHEDDADGDPLIASGTVIEQSTEPDYALIRPDALPAATPIALTVRSTDLLAIIQHPRGRPKVVAEGVMLAECDGLVYYTDLDTLVGSSGAGVLNDRGHLLGVHTDGDCAVDGTGSNHGYTAAAIVEASPYLQAADIADR